MEVFSSSQRVKLLYLVFIIIVECHIIFGQTTAQNFPEENTTEAVINNLESTSISSANATTVTESLDNGTTTTDTSTAFPTTTTQDTTTTEPPCEVSTIQNITAIEVFQTKVNLSISLTETQPSCQPTVIEINCTANKTWDWVIEERNHTLETNESSEILVLDNLSEFTHYTCDFQVINGTSFTNVSFQTKESAPSIPQNLNVTDITANNFTLTWNEPHKIPTTLYGYNLTVKRVKVASENHHWSNCSDAPDEIISRYTTDLFYSFGEALADFEYEVSIMAWSSAGSSSPATLNVTTLVAASEEPRNVSINIGKYPTTRNIDMTLELNWEMPCNTNGPVNYFVFELMGYYKYNESIVQNEIFKLSINSDTELYNYTVPDLMAASNYTVEIYATNDQSANSHGNAYINTISTDENFPNAPETSVQSISPNSFVVNWQKPTNNPGSIIQYEIAVHYQEVNWILGNHCAIDTEYNITRSLSEREFNVTGLIPGTSYSVKVSAETSAGIGNSTDSLVPSSMDAPAFLNISKQIEHSDSIEYDATGIIQFIPGCFNGAFNSYDIYFKGTRTNRSDHSGNEKITEYENTKYSFALRAEYDYVVNVTIQNSELSSTNSISFTSPAGVPIFNETSIASIEPVITSTEAKLVLRKEYFNSANGDLKFMALIVSNENETGGDIGVWDNDSDWPELNGTADIYYQATPKFWNPFVDSDSTIYVIGNDTTCSDDQQFCNRPLKPGKTYFVFVRILNTNYYRNTMPITFVTDPLSKLGLILGTIFGLLAVSTIGFVGFILWRRGIINITNKRVDGDHNRRNQRQYETSMRNCDRDPLINFLNKKESGSKTECSKTKFVEYCNYLERNPDVLNSQWQDLESQSVDVYTELEHHFAVLPENRRKNRYANILPFDHTRVKLNIDEDDEICSDYINASYIKGFSNRNEYIATQGPLPHTVRDFWKMVFQDNVSIIIMVARFIEDKREKCYKYFPNNHETMLFGDDIEVRCCAELDFQIYCVRTLQARKDVKQITVTHMQFLEWPDFGVPQGTDNLLLFCHQLRSRWSSEGGMAVVHCSAGVGRTGTIIATDIIIRAIEAGKKIDVFNTVLDLRRHRKSMVQTEKQYMYIHQLIRNILEDPIVDDEEYEDHTYQNVGLSSNSRGQAESAL